MLLGRCRHALEPFFSSVALMGLGAAFNLSYPDLIPHSIAIPFVIAAVLFAGRTLVVFRQAGQPLRTSLVALLKTGGLAAVVGFLPVWPFLQVVTAHLVFGL